MSNSAQLRDLGIEGLKDNPVIWKEQVVLIVGTACSRDHFISRLEAAPSGFFTVIWTFRISAKDKINEMKLLPAASHGEYGPKRY